MKCQTIQECLKLLVGDSSILISQFRSSSSSNSAFTYSCCLGNKTVNLFCINTVFCTRDINVNEGTKNVVNHKKSYRTREWLDHFLVAEVREEGAVTTAGSAGAAAGPEAARFHFQVWTSWDSQRQPEKPSPNKYNVTLYSLVRRYLHFWQTCCFHY